MERADIQKLLKVPDYKSALLAVRKLEQSTWTRSVELRSLRALKKHKEALNLANKLDKHLSSLSENEHSPELDEQIRYVALVFSEQQKAKRAV